MVDIRSASKQLIRTVVPLFVRKHVALMLQRCTWIDPRRRHWWSMELVRDLADKNIEAFHEFLWTHHFGYAESYEAPSRFGANNIRASRKFFFADLCSQAVGKEAFAGRTVNSIFEVGCSLGYQLRFIETDIFPGATELAGIDIDRYAIESGSMYLRSVGSKVTLHCGDTTELGRWLGGKTYDLIICTGVLMYMNEAAARHAVHNMLRHSRLLAMAGLAHPRIDNALLDQSDVRESDSTFIHNFDRMVTSQGGRVLSRRWEGDRDVDGNTIYFVFATGQ